VRTKISSEYEIDQGRVRRSKKQPLVRGLNRNYSRPLKEAFKGAALSASIGQWKEQFQAMVDEGIDPALARLTLARKISSITLAIWKKGERYNAKKLKFSTRYKASRTSAERVSCGIEDDSPTRRRVEGEPQECV
jgi:hypothetical protein